MKEFIVTFGCGQVHKGRYFVARAEDEEGARELTFATFGRKWSMMYATKEEAGVCEWGYSELTAEEHERTARSMLKDLLALEDGLRPDEIEFLDLAHDWPMPLCGQQFERLCDITDRVDYLRR